MHGGGNQPKKIDKKWLGIGAGVLLCMMMLPSICLLAKMAIGLIILSVTAIAVKVAPKAILNVLEPNQNQTTQNKVMKLVIGLVSIFIGGLSLCIIAQAGLTVACAAVTALALYGCFKDREYFEGEKICKSINDKLDQVADETIDFIVSGVEKFIPQRVGIA